MQGQQMMAGNPQAQMQQRMAMQAQQQIQMLSSKFYNENLPQMLQQHNVTQETCPPELLNRFKMQCLTMARQRVTHIRQQQHQQQQQALAMQQQQAMQQGMMPQGM